MKNISSKYLCLQVSYTYYMRCRRLVLPRLLFTVLCAVYRSAAVLNSRI
jgi:hypothetical protein